MFGQIFPVAVIKISSLITEFGFGCYLVKRTEIFFHAFVKNDGYANTRRYVV